MREIIAPGFANRICFLLLLSALNLAPAWATEITLQDRNPKSRRTAVLEDNEKVAYLYLTQPGTSAPDRDAIAYSRVRPVGTVDWKKLKETGEPPMLGADVASPRAVITFPKAKEFSFRWAKDGHSVALLRNGEPIAMATATDRAGYSKAVAKPGRLANPWDEKRYVELIGESNSVR
jgi:hypothetical protein